MTSEVRLEKAASLLPALPLGTCVPGNQPLYCMEAQQPGEKAICSYSSKVIAKGPAESQWPQPAATASHGSEQTSNGAS